MQRLSHQAILSIESLAVNGPVSIGEQRHVNELGSQYITLIMSLPHHVTHSKYASPAFKGSGKFPDSSTGMWSLKPYVWMSAGRNIDSVVDLPVCRI